MAHAVKGGRVIDQKGSADLRAYLRIVRRHKWMIVLGTAISLIVASLITRYTLPLYEATTTLLISQNNLTSESAFSNDGLQASERLATTYSELITKPSIARKVMDRLRLNISVEKFQKRISAAPVSNTNLINITATDGEPKRAALIATTIADTFSKKLVNIQTDRSKYNVTGSPVKVSVAEPAEVPTAPISPKPALNMLIALFLGLGASTSMAFAVEYFDASIRTSEDLEQAVLAPSLGTIPMGSIQKGIEVLSKPSSNTAEAYRTLRTNLQYLNFDKSLKSIAITSPSAGEGKTTVASNLATTLAKAGNRVILLSCDLRRPKLHEIFCISNERGLSNVLADEAEFEDSLVHVDDGLRVIASGPLPPNPAELLGSTRMKEVLRKAEELADFVILDCAPVLPVTDAAVLAQAVDGFLVVARADVTDHNSIAQARNALDKVSARIAGSILNCSNTKSGYGYSYQYGNYKEATA